MPHKLTFKNEIGSIVALDPETRKMEYHTKTGINYIHSYDYVEDFSVSHHLYTEVVDISYVTEFEMTGDKLIGTINSTETLYRVCPDCGEFGHVTKNNDTQLVKRNGEIIEGASQEYICNNCNGTFHDKVIENPYWYNLTVED